MSLFFVYLPKKDGDSTFYPYNKEWPAENTESAKKIAAGGRTLKQVTDSKIIEVSEGEEPPPSLETVIKKIPAGLGEPVHQRIIVDPQ